MKLKAKERSAGVGGQERLSLSGGRREKIHESNLRPMVRGWGIGQVPYMTCLRHLPGWGFETTCPGRAGPGAQV